MSYVKYFFIIAFIIAFILFLYYAYKKKECPSGFTGADCSTKICPLGFTGDDCSKINCPKNCSGLKSGICDTTTGKCKCNTG